MSVPVNVPLTFSPTVPIAAWQLALPCINMITTRAVKLAS
jgi:hypothetical protein